MFYFTCGKIGHNKEFCYVEVLHKGATKETNQYGVWLRYNEYGEKLKPSKKLTLKIHETFRFDSC